MKIVSLDIRNFRSFKEQQHFDFELSPGLYFLTGENRAEPELGENGAGKSTLWDAVFWMIFGKTTRNLKAANLANWDGPKTAQGVLELDIDGEAVSIDRRWNPNSLAVSWGTEEPREVSQDELEDMLGLSPDAFLNLFIIGQFSSKFFDLQPAQKMDLFTSILDLEFWLDCSKQASKELSDANEERAVVEKRYERLKGREESILDEKDNQIELAERWDQDHEKEVAHISEEIDDLAGGVEDLLEQLEGMEEGEDEDDSEVILKKDIDEARTDRDSVMSDISSKRSEISSELTHIDILESENKKLQGVEGVCSNCKQKVSKRHLEAEIKTNQKEIDRHGKKLDKLQRELENLEAEVEEFDETLETFQKQLEECRREKQQHEQEVRKLENQVDSMNRDRKRLEDELERLKKKSNPHYDRETQLVDELSALYEEIEDAEESKKLLESEAMVLEHWVKAFKQIRLYVVDTALRQLEIEINNCLADLGMQNWEIRLDVERETKSGSVKKGFDVMVLSPMNEEAVPWEAWSGGESQRIRLAGTMGLINWISDVTGIDPNIEVWDEPSAHLSGVGIKNMLDLLRERSERLDKQVWLVDHRSYDYGGFEKVFKIVKDDSGSRMVSLT